MIIKEQKYYYIIVRYGSRYAVANFSTITFYLSIDQAFRVIRIYIVVSFWNESAAYIFDQCVIKRSVRNKSSVSFKMFKHPRHSHVSYLFSSFSFYLVEVFDLIAVLLWNKFMQNLLLSSDIGKMVFLLIISLIKQMLWILVRFASLGNSYTYKYLLQIVKYR